MEGRDTIIAARRHDDADAAGAVYRRLYHDGMRLLREVQGGRTVREG